MEDVVHAGHGVPDRLDVPHIADVEFDFGRQIRKPGLEQVAHIVLLFFVPGENTDLPDVGSEKALQHGIAERSRPAGDQEGFVCKLRYH